MLFFFKQKTAYEIGVRLVGSEMCIRDRVRAGDGVRSAALGRRAGTLPAGDGGDGLTGELVPGRFGWSGTRLVTEVLISLLWFD